MSDEDGPTAKAPCRNSYRLPCHKQGRFLSVADNTHLIPNEQLHRLVDLVAAELGAKSDARDAVQRGVEDAMAGHLMTED